MPRKGWTALETPNGWFQLIRGPRPPSVRWGEVNGDPQPQAHPTSQSCRTGSGHGKMHSPKWPGCRRLSRPWRRPKQQQCCMQGVHREVRTASGLVGGRDSDREGGLVEGRARLARLEDRQPRPPPPQTEVRVEQLMEEISQLRQERIGRTPRSQKSLPSEGFCADVRRRGAGVVGGTSRGHLNNIQRWRDCPN